MDDLMNRPILDLVAEDYDVTAHCFSGCGYVVLIHPNFLPPASRGTVTPADIEAKGRCKRCGAKGPRIKVEIPEHKRIGWLWAPHGGDDEGH